MTVPLEPASAPPPGHPQGGPSPRSAEVARHDRSRAARKALSRGTGFVLFATALVIAVGAWPVIEVAADGEGAATARRGLERALRERGWAVGPPLPAEHRVFGPSHVQDRGSRELLEHLLEKDSFNALEGHVVRARGQLALLESADPSASPIVTVEALAPLLVIKESRNWLLVATRVDDRELLGWAPRQSIVTLP